MFSFPDINVLCATLHVCVCPLAVDPCPFFYSQREAMCGTEDGAQKGFPALEVLAVCAAVLEYNGAVFLKHWEF